VGRLSILKIKTSIGVLISKVYASHMPHALLNGNKFSYLLDKHLLSVCAPRDDKLGIAIRQAFPCDLNEELQITRSSLELLHLGE